MKAAVFPGQGSQHVGMGHEIFHTFSSTRLIFQEAEDLVKLPLQKVMFEGPEDMLRQTQYAQPALFLMSVAFIHVLKEWMESAIMPFSFVAGHSLGEYTAYYVADVLSFSDTLTLIKARSQAMSEIKGGGMLALIGLTLDKVQSLVSSKECSISNDNTPEQVVVSGTLQALSELSEKAQSAGAKRCVFLNVSGPFHSPFMKVAQDVFLDQLDKVTFHTASIPIVTNVSSVAQNHPDILKQDLAQQMTHPVLWRNTQLNLENYGVTDFVEIGAGQVLGHLARKTIPSLSISSLNTLESLRKWFHTSLFPEHSLRAG